MQRTDPAAVRPQFLQSIGAGALIGAGVWASYGVVEFLFASVLFFLTRPYATWTASHWRITGFLVAAYAIAGLVAGALAGAALPLLRSKTSLIRNGDESTVLEHLAVLTLTLSFTVHVLVTPAAPFDKALIAFVGISCTVILLGCIRSERWSARLGLLANSWIVSVLLLGVGEENALAGMQLAHELGAPIRFATRALAGFLIMVVVASVAGARLRPRLMRIRFFSPNLAALEATAALLIISAWLAAGSSGRPQPSFAATGPDAAPNVLIVIMDTVRADHLSLYGYGRDTTPNLKKLAQDSMVFREAVAPSDFTLTSHASLFTGVYPSWHGAYCQPPAAGFGQEMRRGIPTLAELLSAKGYLTLGAAGNLYLRPDFGLQRGFQQFRIPRPVPILSDESWYMLRQEARRVLSIAFDTAEFDRIFARGDAITSEALKMLANRGATPRPFFAFLNYMDAHYPYLPAPPYDRAFPGKHSNLTQAELSLEQTAISLGGSVPAAYREHCISQYDGAIAYVDAQIGNIIDWLQKSGLYDNTIIVIASDHGESFGERQRVGHANSPYQNLLHVALMIKYPGGRNAGTADWGASLIDVAPTILDTLGYAPPPNMQGRDLRRPNASGQRRLFSETFPCAVLQSPDCPRGCSADAVFAPPYKFIRMSNGRREMFDLRKDPNETSNVLSSFADIGDRLSAELVAWTKTTPTQAGKKMQLDPESLRRLKSLGYIQ